MKSIVLFALLSMTSFTYAKTHTLKADFYEESYDVELQDGDELVVSLPNHRSFDIEVELDPSSGASCEVKSMKKTNSKAEIRLVLTETQTDSGWNGCTAIISRNHPSDEDGTGIIQVNFGYSVDD